MKKTLSLLLACAMIFALCACDDIRYSERKSPVPQFDISVSYTGSQSSASDESGAVCYTQDITTAEVSSGHDRTAERVNSSLAELYIKIKNDADYTEKLALDQPEGEKKELSYTCVSRAARCDTSALSLIFDISQDVGGVHAEVTRIARNYNSDSGERLLLKDIAEQPDQLATYVKNYVLGLAASDEYIQDGKSIFFDDFQETVGSLVDAGENWYFSDSGLVFYANPYDIAPYSFGTLEFEIPYSALEEFIKDDYMPVEENGENGLILAEDGDKTDRDNINIIKTITIDEGYKSVVLSAEETVYDVKIFDANGTTIWQRNYLTSGEGVDVISDIPDVMPKTCISYELADGTVIERGIFMSGEDGSILLVELDQPE